MFQYYLKYRDTVSYRDIFLSLSLSVSSLFSLCLFQPDDDPLNSDDDAESDEDNVWETDNTIVCQFEKVIISLTRSQRYKTTNVYLVCRMHLHCFT